MAILVTVLKSPPGAIPITLANAVLKPRTCSELGCGSTIDTGIKSFKINMSCSCCPRAVTSNEPMTVKTLTKSACGVNTYSKIGKKMIGTILVITAIAKKKYAVFESLLEIAHHIVKRKMSSSTSGLAATEKE